MNESFRYLRFYIQYKSLEKTTVPKRDIHLFMLKVLAEICGRVHKLIRVRELAASH